MNLGVLARLAELRDSELNAVIEKHDPGTIVDELAAAMAARTTGRALEERGLGFEITCHTPSGAFRRFLSWSGGECRIGETPSHSRRSARIEWQRLEDAVRYELGRITMEGLGLVGRLTMSATAEDLELARRAERVPRGAGGIIRSLQEYRNLTGRKFEKAVRSVDTDALLLEQQRVTNEAIGYFNLLGELTGHTLEWRVGESSDLHIAQTTYEFDRCVTRLGVHTKSDGMLHWLRAVDFVSWIMGRTNVATLAVEGKLRFDGNFGIIEKLGRIPEPFDAVERWSTN